MNTCKTCKHWERCVLDPKIWIVPEGQIEVVGECHLIGMSNFSDNSDIRVYDDSLPVNTEQDFGCIHWYKKE